MEEPFVKPPPFDISACYEDSWNLAPLVNPNLNPSSNPNRNFCTNPNLNLNLSLNLNLNLFSIVTVPHKAIANEHMLPEKDLIKKYLKAAIAH